MTNFFCQLPFVAIDTDGESARPCCVFAGDAMTLTDYWQNRQLQEVKIKLLQGEPPRQCSECVRQESVSGHSFRTLNNDFHSDVDHDIKSQGMAYRKIRNLNMVTSTVCNLKCLPCESGSYARSQELYQIGITAHRPRPDPLRDWRPLLEFDIDTLNFSGGEPFYDHSFDIMKGFVGAGRSSGINLTINTNLTAITHDQLQYLSDHFRSVTIKGSIDGVGAVNDYLRYPSTWSTIQRAVDLIQQHNEIGFLVTTALSNLALLQYPDLVRWAHSQGIKDIFISQVTRPRLLSCQMFFAEHRDSLQQQFLNLKHVDNLSNRTLYCIDMCLDLCKNSTDADVPFRSELLDYLGRHDVKRGTSWRQVFDTLTL